MLLTFMKDIVSSVVVRAILLILFTWWLKWIWGRRRFYYLSYKIPGPTSVPLFGNMMQLGCFTDHNGIMPRLKAMKDKYGDFFRVWFGPEFLFVITQPEDYECILTSKETYNKGFIYDMMQCTINFGLLCGSGELWKKHRHIINPAFATSSIKKYQSNHNFYARKMAEHMTESVNKGLADIAPYIQRYAADTSLHSLYETKSDFYTGNYDDVLDVLVRGAVIVHERMCKFWLRSDTIFQNSGQLYKEYKYVYKTYEDFFHPKIEKKIQEIIETTKKNKETIHKVGSYENLNEDYILEENENEKGRSIVNVMTEAYMAGDISIKEILDEFDNIFTPSADTSYTQLSAFILMMGMHRHVQDKLWKELKEFYSYDMDAEVSRDHFNHLPYLDMCAKESMRHFPTGPMQMRVVKEDFFLKSRNMVVPAGTQFLLPNIWLHKEEKYWKDPLKFDPERFTPEECAKRPFFAYIPFSAGLRNCIGQVFGLDTVKIGAIHLLRKFEFTADPTWKMETLPMSADISLRSALGYKLVVKPRERNV